MTDPRKPDARTPDSRTPDSRTLTRVFDELLWSLRRGGLKIPVSSAIDALAVLREVGLEDRDAVTEGLAAVVVKSKEERPRFDRIVRDFFERASPHEGLTERLLRQGFSASDVAELVDLLERLAASANEDGGQFAALLQRGPELDRLFHLAGISRTLASVESPLQLGFFTHRVLGELGIGRAHDTLARLRAHLREALGQERGDALADALKAELDRTAEEVRAHLRESVVRRSEEIEARSRSRTLDTTAFTALTDAEVLEVRRAVRTFGERLRGAERVRIRRAKHGRVDLSKTMRRAATTGGVPFVLVRKRRRRDKPKLFLLCDVSDSVRSAARFMLELAYVAQELFERTRSFVFVSELGETTELFESQPVTAALGHAYGGGVVSVADNSNYGRVLRTFEEHHLAAVDRRTTVVILGDGRTNYHDDAAEVLDRIRARARALVWLCPEERAGWLTGDSAMPRYAPRCTRLFEVKNARELEAAARGLAGLR
jgi:uncharacterized protein with von Willebrand factor type A (vWA) domain